jgi:hypothetical protein
MSRCATLFFPFLLMMGAIHAQKASIHVRLVDSSTAMPSGYLFEVEIKNDSFPSYWLQDTAFIRAYYGSHGVSHLYTILLRKVNGEYKSYDKWKRRPGDAFTNDSCYDNCCNCIFLKTGESVKMNLPLLAPYNMEKGDYEIEVVISAPEKSCNYCEQLYEIHTDVYFRVL